MDRWMELDEMVKGEAENSPIVFFFNVFFF